MLAACMDKDSIRHLLYGFAQSKNDVPTYPHGLNFLKHLIGATAWLAMTVASLRDFSHFSWSPMWEM